jgi:LPS-assembly protein
VPRRLLSGPAERRGRSLPAAAPVRPLLARPLLAGLLLAALLGPAAATAAQEPDETEAPETMTVDERVQKPVLQEAEEAAAEEAAENAEGAEPEAAEGASETAPAAPPPEPPAAERPRFELPLPEEDGGGVVRGRAASLEFLREDYAAAAGGVEIQYQDVKLTADRVEIDLATQVATATGDVVFDQGPRRITAIQATFDLKTKTGTFEEATAFVQPDYYFRGARVEKVAENVYTVDDGVFTSCAGENPSWSFRLGRARVEVEGYARIRNASMRVKKVPVLYTPYIVWPAKQERTSGLLIPEIGYSDRKGTELGLAYYQTLGRSFDTTFHVDAFTEGYLGLGNELRYRPTEGTSGIFVGYAVRDPEAEDVEGLDEWRWKVDWDHVTEDLPWDLRGVLSYHDFSDFQFFRDFERDFDRNTIRTLESRGFVSGDWGAHSLNVLVNEQQTFLAPARQGNPERTITQAKLPEIEYRLRPTRIFGEAPLYLDVLSSLSYLALDRQRNYNDSYGRFDLFPRLTVPLRTVPWLSLSLNAGGRMTWYGNSIYSLAEFGQLPEEQQDNRFKDEALTRTVPVAGAEIVGPSFSRIFDAEAGGFTKFKHVVEPRFTATWLGDFEEQENVPVFDEVDNLRNTAGGLGLGSTKSGRWSLVNRLLAKAEPPAPEEDGEEDGEGDGAEDAEDGNGEAAAAAPAAVVSAREVASFELTQEISFDEEQPLQVSSAGEETQQGPVSARFRFTPSLATNLAAQVDYSTFFENLASTSFSGTWRFDRGNLGATWFTRYNAEDGESRSDQVRFLGGFDVVEKRLRLETQINYDLEQSLLQQQSYVLSYNSQCYALRLEMRDFRTLNERDTEYYFTLSLKNVGTFLPLVARSTTALP